jgi:hypothetical protein
MNKKIIFIVVIAAALSILAGGGIGYYVVNQKSQSIETQKTISSIDKFKKYTSSRLASRAIVEYAEDLVRELKPKPPESARFYAFVTTTYSEIYTVQKNSDHGLESARQIINQMYPEKTSNTDEFIGSLIKSRTGLTTDETKVLSSVLELEKTDGFRTIKWDDLIPSGTGKWTKKDINPFSPTAGQWKRWLVSENYDYQVPEPIKPGDPRYEDQKKAVIQATTNRGPNEINDINYWGGGPGTEAPSGIWQNKMYETVKPLNLSDEEYANSQKILAQSLADSFMEVWKVKYTYWTERPSMAIPNLSLAMPNPNFPGYVSGHSAISRTAAEVLGTLYPQYKDSFLKDAITAKNSRLSAGVHFPMDNEEGFKLGEKIGKQVLFNLGKTPAEDTAALKAGESKMKTYVTDKSHDYNNPQLKDRIGYLYKVTDTNPKPIPTSLLSAENATNLNGKDGFQFEQIGADPFWLPGACASLPSYKIDNKNLLTLVGKVEIDGNKTADKYVVYNYVTKKFTYLYNDKETPGFDTVRGELINKNVLEQYLIPNSDAKQEVPQGAPYSLFDYKTDYILQCKADLIKQTFTDTKVPLPQSLIGKHFSLNISSAGISGSIYKNLTPITQDGKEYFQTEIDKVFTFTVQNGKAMDYREEAYYPKDGGGLGPNDNFLVSSDYEKSKVIVTGKDGNIFTEIQLRKGLQSSGRVYEDTNYLRLDISPTQIGLANTLYIDKSSKEVRAMVSQEYTTDSEGVNTPKYPIFSLGSIEPDTK